MGVCSAANGMARRRASYEMEQQAQAYEAQQQQAQQQIETHKGANRSTTKTKTTTTPTASGRPHTEVIKYAELKKQGILTEEEFQKLKMDLLSRM